MTAGEAEARRSFQEAVWPREARSSRIVAALLIVAVIAGPWTEPGKVPPVLAAALQALSCLSIAPMMAATFSRRPPPWLDRARLLALAGVPLGVTGLMYLGPTGLLRQAWPMIGLWGVLALTIQAPLRAKLAVLGAGAVVYLTSLQHTIHSLGSAYGGLNEGYNTILSTLTCVLGLPLVPNAMAERRFREFTLRRRTEREIALREERERLLAAALAAAERAEQEALAQKERADRAAAQARRDAQERAELIANMSHDLRTPMAGILGLVELLRATRLTPEQADYVATIRASNQTLLALLNDILDVSRIEEGVLPLSPVPVALAEVLRTPAELLRVNAHMKGVALRVELAEDLPRHVALDPTRVQQILLNLLGNALKFTPRGTVTLRAAMVAREGRRGRLRVEVEDTGIGFTPEQGRRLFQRFRQAEDSTAQTFGGSGLGLSICKGLVALMAGTIGAESVPHTRTVFWFEIPVEEAAPPSAGSQGALPTMRILLAEDNPVNQMVLGRMLQKLGQTVTFADDGRQAQRLLQDQAFDLALLDMQMPEMGGDELTRALRSQRSAKGQLYVVALTAAATAEERAHFWGCGVDALYTKPIDMDGLRELLAHEGPLALARASGLAQPRA